jgi:hypothetical protein
LNDLENKEEENFFFLLKMFKNNPKLERLFFKFISKSLRTIKTMKNQHNRTRKYLIFTKLFTKFSDTLLDMGPDGMVNTIKKLPFNCIYDYLIYLPRKHEKVKFCLLEHIELNGKSHVIKDKILYFGLVCKFRPEKAREQADLLNISEFKKCLEIAIKEKCWSVVAFIKFKQGEFKSAFEIYAKL